MFHGLPDFGHAHLKEVGVTQNQEIMTLEISQPFVNYNFLCRKAHMSRMVMK